MTTHVETRITIAVSGTLTEEAQTALDMLFKAAIMKVVGLRRDISDTEFTVDTYSS